MRKKKFVLLCKVISCFLILILFIVIIKVDRTKYHSSKPTGDEISIDDVLILVESISEKKDLENVQKWLQSIKENRSQIGKQKLKCEDLKELITAVDCKSLQEKSNGLLDEYGDHDGIIKEDWYIIYDEMLEELGLQETIQKKEFEILGTNGQIIGVEQENTFAKKLLLTDGQWYSYLSEEWEDFSFFKVEGYQDTEKKILLTVIESKKGSVQLHNVWIMESGEYTSAFYKGNQIKIKASTDQQNREKVADLTFVDGKLEYIERLEEKVSGKLLEVLEDQLVLDKVGSVSIDPECQIYDLVTGCRNASREELKIGYDFADYIIKDHKICAILILRKEKMENIRVLIMNQGYQDYYHEALELVADCNLKMEYGSYESRKEKIVKMGEILTLEKESKELQDGRVTLTPQVNSGKIKIQNLKRADEEVMYRGMLELVKKPEGILVINEVPLEEYLYSVLPSEMPASYQEEALKAQAICARTYAYQYLIRPDLPSYGANLDDSVNYQVYNNIAEHMNTTNAVKATYGTVLLWEDHPVSTYYYSTSCGFGSDDGAWSQDGKSACEYLVAQQISKEASEQNRISLAENMKEEKEVRAYLSKIHEDDYESDLPWYRWKYEVPKLDAIQMSKNSGFSFSKIKEISVSERSCGGTVTRLSLITDSGTFEIQGEYHIRQVLNQGGVVVRQDGEEISLGNLLPSAFLVIDCMKKGGNVIGYSLLGGGYGHGIGMSQNGANQMAVAGKNATEILSYFYPGCELSYLYR